MDKQNTLAFILISLAAGIGLGFGIASVTNNDNTYVRVTETCAFRGGIVSDCISYLKDEGYQIIDIIYRPISARQISSATSFFDRYYSSDNGYVIGERFVFVD